MSDPSSRIMPERLVIGTSGNASIRSIISDCTNSRRPLLPGERYLGAYIVPDFQRALVWTLDQKVRLIESIYMGLPIGSIVWNQSVAGIETDGWLLDGQQRVTTICQWMDGEFEVRGWRFTDLPDVERRHFERMTVPIVETSLKTRAECEDVYDRLVYGGTPHAPKVIENV